jgi:tripartite-type tricarboxylate transporter receptor subunit TctC
MTYRRLDYDFERDFVPVAHLVDVPTVVSTSASSPYQNMGQYVAWVRANPERSGVGLTSLGGLLHFSILAMSKTIGVPLNPVSYKGGAPLATDLVGGHVPIGTDALASQLELHRAGKVRILGVSGMRRNRALPDVPTLKEAGIDGFDHANAWYGAYVPAGTPAAEVQRLERALIAAVNQPQVQAQLARMGLEPTGRDGAAAANLLRTERTFWRPVVEASGFRADE